MRSASKRLRGFLLSLLAPAAACIAAGQAPAPSREAGAAGAEAFLGARRASGIVYWDANGNGRRDEGEQGAGGVAVSTGRALAVTDDAGKYEASSNEPFLTVSVCFPSGSWPTTEWFRRTRSEREEGLDFGLRREPQDYPLVFVQFTDVHGSLAWAAKTMPAELAKLSAAPKFYVFTGDLHGGNPTVRDVAELRRRFGPIVPELKPLAKPVFLVPGNHDTVGYGGAGKIPITPEDTRHPLFGNRAWEAYVCPANWSFDCAGVRLVGVEYGDYVGGKWSTFSPGLKSWLEARLKTPAAAERTILLAHRPNDLAKTYEMTLGLAGDSHTEGVYVRPGQETPAYDERMLVAGVAQHDDRSPRHTQDGRPAGYRIVVVEKDRIDTFYKAFGVERPIMVNSPRRFQGVKVREIFTASGQVYDPACDLKSITVELDGKAMQVRKQGRRFWTDFEATLPAEGLVDGFHELTVGAEGPGGTAHLSELHLLLTGKPEAFTAGGPAKVEGAASGLTQPAKVLVNGVEIGEIPADAKSFSLEAPAKVLKRLNVVTVSGAGGRNALSGLRVTYEGKTFIDHHRVFRWGFGNALSDGKALYFDLTKPKAGGR